MNSEGPLQQLGVEEASHFETPRQPEAVEVDSGETALEKIESAKSRVSDLTQEGERRLSNIEQNAGLSDTDISAVREEVGLTSHLGKIRDRANHVFDKLKTKFTGASPKEEPEKVERPTYDRLREYLRQEQHEISRPVIEEARRKRNELLEARGLLTMSKEDFYANFSSVDFEVRADLKQQNVGDCYAVAAIHAMSRSPHFETICRSSMKKLPDGSWQVRVPLMSENGQMIIITPEEISPQMNSGFLGQNKKAEIIPDFRRKLLPLKGKEGMRVLEAAFIKQKFGSVDRLSSEGGWGEEVLLSLGGDNFKEYTIKSATWNAEKTKWEHPGLVSLGEKRMAFLDHYLENFDPEIHIATVSTKHGVGKISGFYRVKGAVKFLVPGHAYSVSGVDTEKRIIRLANPWDTSTSLELTFEQFKESFSAFSAIRIDSAKLLANMTSVKENVT